MTPQEVIEFRSKFKSIVYTKGTVTEQIYYIRRLEGYNKNGSHEDAIKKAIDRLNKIRDKYKALLEGKSYNQWKEFSHKLAVNMNKLKASVTKKEKYQQIINELKF